MPSIQPGFDAGEIPAWTATIPDGYAVAVIASMVVTRCLACNRQWAISADTDPAYAVAYVAWTVEHERMHAEGAPAR